MALVEPDIIENRWDSLRGLEEGIERGREQALREVLLTTLHTRGLRVTVTQRARITATHDVATLSAWIKAALSAKTTGQCRDATRAK